MLVDAKCKQYLLAEDLAKGFSSSVGPVQLIEIFERMGIGMVPNPMRRLTLNQEKLYRASLTGVAPEASVHTSSTGHSVITGYAGAAVRPSEVRAYAESIGYAAGDVSEELGAIRGIVERTIEDDHNSTLRQYR